VYRLDEVTQLLRGAVARSSVPDLVNLTDQIDEITEAEGPVTMIRLATASKSRAEIPDGPLPLATVAGERGDSIGELLLWLAGGLVVALEFAWWSDGAPTRLPDVSMLSASRGER
jgi:hypothetical protein